MPETKKPARPALPPKREPLDREAARKPGSPAAIIRSDNGRGWRRVERGDTAKSLVKSLTESTKVAWEIV